MVCQNQSIDDSDAPLARDLRILVRERLTAGDSDKQVMDYLVARYGQFVLLRPRFEWQTALLWLTPALVLMIGAIGAIAFVRRRNAVLARGRRHVIAAALSPTKKHGSLNSLPLRKTKLLSESLHAAWISA